MFRIGLLIFVLLLWKAEGGIYSYNDKQLEMDDYFMARVGMFSPSSSPSNTSPGNGKSFVEVDVSFNRETNSSSTGNIQFLLFRSQYKHLLGIVVDKKQHICCTEDLLILKKCSKVGTVILNETYVGKDYWQTEIMFDAHEESKTFQTKQDIITSGIYYLYFINCRASDTGDVKLNGKVVFMNPFGYLPGELYYYLPFYLSLSLVYLLIGIIWFILSAKYWKQLLKLQNWIAAVIALGMLEMATLYFDNLGYNNSGENYVAAMIVGVIVSTFKRTVSRVLVLVVSMGFGVVKSTLGANRYKILLLAVLYFIFSGVLNIVDLVQRTTVVSLAVLLLLVFPSAILDTTFYWWIFYSLLRTISQLGVRKQTIKLRMYKRFFATLIISGLLSSLVIIVQMFVTVTSDPDNIWQTNWLWTAFWQILYLIILVAIVFLWRPTSNNTRYAYSEMNDMDTEEITLQPLSPIGDMLQRSSSVKLEEQAPSKVVEIPVSFSIDDDDRDEELERSKLQ